MLHLHPTLTTLTTPTPTVTELDQPALEAEHAALTAELKRVASTYGSSYAEVLAVCYRVTANERAQAAVRWAAR
jgi:hypothetical protein